MDSLLAMVVSAPFLLPDCGLVGGDVCKRFNFQHLDKANKCDIKLEQKVLAKKLLMLIMKNIHLA